MFSIIKIQNPGNRRVRIHFFIMAEIIPEKHPNLFIIPESRTITCVCPFQHTSESRGNHEDNFYLEGLYMNDIFRNDFSASYTIHYADGMSFAVFDGMGGAAYGEVASEIAVQTLRKYEKKLKHATGHVCWISSFLRIPLRRTMPSVICSQKSTARTAELLLHALLSR